MQLEATLRAFGSSAAMAAGMARLASKAQADSTSFSERLILIFMLISLRLKAGNITLTRAPPFLASPISSVPP